MHFISYIFALNMKRDLNWTLKKWKKANVRRTKCRHTRKRARVHTQIRTHDTPRCHLFHIESQPMPKIPFNESMNSFLFHLWCSGMNFWSFFIPPIDRPPTTDRSTKLPRANYSRDMTMGDTLRPKMNGPKMAHANQTNTTQAEGNMAMDGIRMQAPIGQRAYTRHDERENLYDCH